MLEEQKEHLFRKILVLHHHNNKTKRDTNMTSPKTYEGQGSTYSDSGEYSGTFKTLYEKKKG